MGNRHRSGQVAVLTDLILRGISDEASRCALEGTGPIQDVAMKWMLRKRRLKKR